jgi:hypothetical protein
VPFIGRYKPVLCVSESENDNSAVIQSACNIGRPVFMNKVITLYAVASRLKAETGLNYT